MTLLNSKLSRNSSKDPCKPRQDLTTDYTDFKWILLLLMLLLSASVARAQVLGDPIDVSQDSQKFVADQKQQGFHISLWQYTYFTSKNDLWKEMVAKGYHVRNEGGQLPFEDATLDMSNPEAVKWYQGKLRDLLKLGVGAIKVDFGEGAGDGSIRFGDEWLVRAQPVSVALQRGSG